MTARMTAWIAAPMTAARIRAWITARMTAWIAALVPVAAARIRAWITVPITIRTKTGDTRVAPHHTRSGPRPAKRQG
ncbi:hypothetical protein [Streptomyces albipurpureus]|uniref:Uncharacterized protein n=1 Tax=Streptomyces albipurpureus TaxID=2897419 RepID=A0ABT0UKA5_9ACTN|nr:hypothetical protein [Streptomyces sp. CWNU-1]MCM2388890.1 hypothetical protein [Streptomyces sp. CWNU-1]